MMDLIMPAATHTASDERAEAVYTILHTIEGEYPDREGLLNTPNRVARMLDELTVGYTVDLKALLNGALFEVEYDEIIVVGDIEFYSMCEHHMLPFFGRAHVGYLPNKRVIGLSKIPRIVEMYARRLQLQERMTHQIAATLQEVTEAQGVGVIVEAQHMCSMMRGIKKHSSMTTSAMLGAFRDDAGTKAEFMQLVK